MCHACSRKVPSGRANLSASAAAVGISAALTLGFAKIHWPCDWLSGTSAGGGAGGVEARWVRSG
eukprot:653811-Prymnesium_polylepis.1